MEFGRVCLLLVISVFAVDALSWKNCDPNAPAQIRQVNLSPTPVVLREGQKITISGSASVQGVVGVNYKIKLNIQKKAWFWVKIPCISKVGSCTYSGITCQKIWQELNQPAQCPLKTGIHALPRQTITIPAVNLPSFLTSGQYWVRARLYDADRNRQVACVEVNFNIKA